ncbi:MAG: response regulator [Desulfobulbaceae bacterium]|nr:response regulator [Desulfobulbaceae bacterium]
MSKKILIVDDNPQNRLLAGDILAFHGYAVNLAVDGQEGIALAEQLHPDLVLMDIQMPRLDGFAALIRLRENPATRDLPVIAMTAMAMRGDHERILAAGFAGYLAKPINSRELPRVVAQFLGEKTE